MTVPRMVRLEEVAEICGGSTPSRQVSAYFGGGIAWATPTDITALNGLYVGATKETVTQAGLANSSTKLMQPGAVLLTSRATIGFTAVATVPICTNQGFVNFVCGPDLVPEYLAYWLRTQKSKMLQQAGGTTFKEIGRGALRKFEMVLPSLAAQRQIVDCVSRADGIVRLRREAQEKSAELVPSIFLEMFGDPVSNPKGWPVVPLCQVSDVQGGLQVTTKRASLPLDAPYLRVANVYRSRLDLREIKSIRLTAAELQRTRLLVGDLLFVEGHGNPLEVGRCAVWDGSIDGCTHQNHLIRARPDKTKLLPEFACASLNSVSGRRTLVDTGKTTSGLSTISAQNVKQAKLMLPPLSLQELFKQRANDAGSIVAQQIAATTKAESIFNALLAQSFA